MRPIDRLHALGQSIWYDNIERRLLKDGTLAELIANGEIRGVTSNPSIFNKAISGSQDYDTALQSMAWAGWHPERIFFQLAIEDIQRATDLFLPLYRSTKGGDGYVSLEVNPTLAHDTRGTVAQAKKLWHEVNRPNLMIKIPATVEGIPAVRQCITAGLNINITLIFSLERYKAVMEAYLSGLEERIRNGDEIDQITSVASFFVSRVDTKIDPRLAELAKEPALKYRAESLLGKAAIANARLAYELFQNQFTSSRFQMLKSRGGNLQRPLWASTSTKNPAYRDVIYVEQLIGPDTVNTIPPQTLDAFRKHGKAALTLEKGIREAHNNLQELERLGIHMDKVTAELEQEGVEAFSKAFSDLLKTIETRSAYFRTELGNLAPMLKKRMDKMEKNRVANRIWQHDPTVWVKQTSTASEIGKRLGWLNAPSVETALLSDLVSFAQACIRDGFTHAVLLGMGGSSLAPEVMRDMLVNDANEQKKLKFIILDSTDPRQVKAAEKWAPVEKTLYIVASKSGGTAEVDALFRYFWERTSKLKGKNAGQAFIAITDPGTSLESLAKELHFRKVFLADPTVGGRYSALTLFGLVPAALMGVDISLLVDSGRQMAGNCQPENPGGTNPGLSLGALIGEAALQGRNKLTIITDHLFAPFGPWLEQLIAESSGKLGKGILPVVHEPALQPGKYGSDRLFVYFKNNGQSENRIQPLIAEGHPVVTININDAFELGGEFFRWEFATVVACAVIGVNAFDQPDVQDSKDRTQVKIREYQRTHKLVDGKLLWEDPHVALYGQPLKGLDICKSLVEVLRLFSAQIKPGDYVAINAYLPRNPANIDLLQNLRSAVLNHSGNATMLGFGPRFLHSTGQLHKGGSNNGIFIQITADPIPDLPIPGQVFSFATLEHAQALGDLEALMARKRRVLRIHMKTDGLKALVKDFGTVFR
jgi:transaldolase/glucose-6-phosphate isomerase